MRLLSLIVTVAVAFAGLAQAAPSAVDQAAIATVEAHVGTAPKTLAERMADLKVPGVSIAFIENGQVKWAKAYGVTAAGGTQAVTPDTLFQAASMSKAFAAVAALRLVDQGKLDLDTDVNGRLKTWKVPASAFTASSKVTLRRLLSHTAGMTVSGFPGYASDKPIPSLLQILDGAAPSNTPAIQSFEAPGSPYAYSGGGFTVAQLLIVEAGGKPYPDLLKSMVLDPAGMRQSTFAQPLPQTLAGRAASGHDRKGAVVPGRWNAYPEYAAAGLWTTASDYGRFAIALQNAYAGRPHALLKPATAQTMMTPVDAAAGYGLGVVVGKRGGHPFFTHSGSNVGYQCNYIAFLEGAGQGAVVMTNGDAGGPLAADIIAALAEAYHWGAPDPANGASRRRAPDKPAAVT